MGGIKTLISENHYDEPRSWQIYARDEYARAKARLDPAGRFPGLYEKVHAARRRAPKFGKRLPKLTSPLPR